ncbi:(d)CMP kinase [Candidatus Daviesbacteria bacterium]|nr:(d)CMP kinase [Candidatus Daviesbacteria bacterium]
MPNIITIDGPTSSGKSSIGHLFSQKINYRFIDTGAIYRIGSLVALRKGVLLSDEESLADIFKNLEVSFKGVDGQSRIFLDKEDVTDILHNPEITSIVATVASYAKVRNECKKLQRKIGLRQNTVMVGRDIGSEIFPDSKLKFFITASAEVRAKRRYDQLVKKDLSVKLNDVLDQMLERDKKDTTRKASPMRIPKGAVVIDTSKKTVEQTVAILIDNFRNTFG